jgi:hypothetical protein
MSQASRWECLWPDRDRSSLGTPTQSVMARGKTDASVKDYNGKARLEIISELFIQLSLVRFFLLYLQLGFC